MRGTLSSLALASALFVTVLSVTGCAVYPSERAPTAYDIRGGQPVPDGAVATLPPGSAPQSTYQPTYQPYPGPQAAPPAANPVYPPVYQHEPAPAPGYSSNYPPPNYANEPVPGAYPSSAIACGITGGDFLFFGNKNRKYQPVSFAVMPGETQMVQVVQDDSARRDRIYVQGDLSGVGVRITRNQPSAPGSGLSTYGASGAFVSSEPQLVRGVSQPLNINDMFRGATINCGFRSPPGVLPGRRYRGD